MTSQPANSSEQPKGTQLPGDAQLPAEGTRDASRSGIFSLSEMRQEMDKLWESVMSGRWPRLAAIHASPAMDVFERDGMIHVRADLPGMSEGDLTVESDPEGITISGEKREEMEIKEENYFRAERSHGKFTRRIALPARADPSKATATFRNGVLDIEMPIRPEPEKKRIAVHS